ncbi:Uncharacterised protein [Enterobacter ludwigii]|nr:Uncharacterised protein [Enterobacter ludwigii]
MFAVQGHGDQGTFRKVSAGTADAQILTFLHRVQHVVAAQGTEAHGRQSGIDGHVMGAGSGIARGIGDADADRHGAILQRGNHVRRNAHAPVARGVQHGGVGLAAKGHGDFIARRRAGGRAADDLRLCMLGHVNHVVARHGVDGHDRHRHVDRQVMIHRGRVTRLVTDGGRHGHAAVRERRQVGCRNVQRPVAVCAHGGGVVLPVQAHGDRLARFGGAGTGHRQVSFRFGRIQDVVSRQGVNRYGRRGGVHAVLATRRRAVAVDVGDAHLHAGIALFQTGQVSRRHRRRPFAVGIHRRRIGFTAEEDADGLILLHVGGGAREHQIRTLLSRVNHIIRGNGVNPDGDRRKVHRHIVANRHRRTGAVLPLNGDSYRACRQRANIGRRNSRTPGAVSQHGGRIGFIIYRYGQCGPCRQSFAGAGHDQVLTMFDAVDHIVTRHGIHAQARQAGVDGDIALAGAAVAHAVSHAGGDVQFAVTQCG